MIFLHALKELLRDYRFTALFLFNLSLGLSGLLTTNAFRESLQDSLSDNARSLLGADLSLSVRRPWTKAEEANLDLLRKKYPENASAIEAFSMIRNGNLAKLALVKGVSENFPLRGKIRLSKGGEVEYGHLPLRRGQVWIEPDLGRQLNLSIGDNLQVGQVTLLVVDFIAEDTTVNFRSMALAGRLYLTKEDLLGTGLIRNESTASYIEFFRMSDPVAAKTEAGKLFSDIGVQVKAANDAADDAGRFLSYLSDFLGLASLVALFLSALGATYLFRVWMVRRSKTFALHQVLGLSFFEALSIPLLQLVLWSLLAVFPALGLATVLLYSLSFLIAEFSPVQVQAHVTFSTLALAFFLSSIGSFFISLPFFRSLLNLHAKDLLQGQLPTSNWKVLDLVLLLPAGLFFFVLSVWQAKSYVVASGFFLAVLFSFLGLGFLGRALLYFLGIFRFRSYAWYLRQAVLYLTRKGSVSLPAFVSLAFGSLLLNLLPQLRAGLTAELTTPKKLPSLFLFDIQDDQIAAIRELVNSKGFRIENESPLVRARLIKINERLVERSNEAEAFRTREEEQEARFRNRGVNLTFSTGLKDSEKIVSGRALVAGTQIPEVSVEQRYAARMGIALDDTLLFDVQGVEVVAVVKNFRSVRWTSFQPNFFLSFREGVLDDAPKIYLGSIAGLGPEQKQRLQAEMAQRFANVSVVDIQSSVERGLATVEKMRWAFDLMSLLALFSGFLVIYSIVERQAQMRRNDLNLCRILGSSKKHLLAQQLVEITVLSFSASVCGAVISVGMAWAMGYYLFENVFQPSIVSILVSVLVSVSGGALISFFIGSSALQKKPADLLNG